MGGKKASGQGEELFPPRRMPHIISDLMGSLDLPGAVVK
jgi:hypothetical protein